ncbi:MAG: biotin synthase BioB, partial [Solirubrobacterales bacterium]
MLPAWLQEMVAAGLERRPPAAEDGLALLGSGDEPILDVIAAGARVRRRFFGARVKLNFLISMKSGACPEDCAYCSQSRRS